jgi:metallo-beta-lactamase family protein
MRLSFHGADRIVTGSCHMLEWGGHRILIDCGMLQGSRELDEENADPLGFDPAAIGCVLLTHAHLDHCGRLPLLVKQGFRGEIIATAATRDLTRLVLLDAAHLQDEEARWQARHARRRGSRAARAPLYTLMDALDAMDRFGRTAQYATPIDVFPGLRASFHDAGHILGSASILLDIQEDGRHRTILYSGDLGSAGRPLLRAPAPPGAAEVIVMESTYGDRLHRPYGESAEELCTAIIQTFSRGGNVVIPTFALERAQEILFVLRKDVEERKLPKSLQVYLDSPMAISATEIFKRHPDCYSPDVAGLFAAGHDPFQLPGLQFTRDVSESMAINRLSGGAVILAGSGMCTGGRVRHHLRYNLGRAESSVIFVGYAARGSLARRIIDGAQSVKLWGEEIPVRAAIHTINGFSAHADQQELLSWHRGVAGCEVTFLVHGEELAMQKLSGELHGSRIEMPKMHEAFEL